MGGGDTEKLEGCRENVPDYMHAPNYLCLSASGMAPSPEFGMDVKMNQAQKMNNKVDGTPKTEPSKKVAYNKADFTKRQELKRYSLQSDALF